MRSDDKIREISLVVSNALMDDFSNVKIVDIKVREDVDFDGEEILHIDIFFDGNVKGLDARRLSSISRHIRPRLREIHEEALPIFSFIAQGEAGATRREPV